MIHNSKGDRIFVAMLKYVYLLIGLLFVGIGFVGVAIPGLPTTPFMILAAAMFIKSSDRLYRWLLNHRTFGKSIRDYQEHRVIRKQVKVISILLMSVMVTISVVFLIPNIYIKLLVVTLGIVGAVFILRHPSHYKSSDEKDASE